MAQATDYTIDNSTGANVRADINTVLEAIATNNSGSSAPSNTQPTQFFADTSAGIMKLRNTANSGYVNLFTLAGGVDVDAASNFNEDVTFQCASGNIIFDKSDNALEFSDSVLAKFGAGDDLTITHNGTDSRIINSTGDLKIRSNILKLETTTGEEYIRCTANGSVDIFNDNVVKLTTNADGYRSNDDVKAQFGNSSDLQIFHGSNHSFIKNITNELRIGSNFIKLKNDAYTESYIEAEQNGEVKLFHDNAQKFATKSYGAAVTGNFVTTGTITLENASDLFLEDNGKIKFGTGNDFEVYHNGTNAIVDNNTGVLSLQTTSNLELNVQSNFRVLTKGGSENCIQGITDGAVELYFDNSGPKFETESTGVLVGGKYRQKSSGGNIVYARQVFRESIAANTTKTFTITGLAYGNVKLTMGFGDGNFHYATFAAVLGGNMFSSGNAYAAAELLNDRSGVNSITVTKSNSSYAVAIHAGTNQIFGSVVVESNGYDSHGGVTLTIS